MSKLYLIEDVDRFEMLLSQGKRDVLKAELEAAEIEMVDLGKRGLKFALHKAQRHYVIDGRRKIAKGTWILKVIFPEWWSHKSRSGLFHIDIFGRPLGLLRSILKSNQRSHPSSKRILSRE